MSEYNSEKQGKGKLKVSIQELLGPLLKRILVTKSSPKDETIKKIQELVEMVNNVTESKQNWDSLLIGLLGEIERQLDYCEENKGEECELISSEREESVKNWVELKDELKKLLEEPGVHPKKKKFYKKNTFAVSEPSNRNYQANDGCEELQEYANRLTPEVKNYLLGLSMFPENAEIKRNLLVYWWIGLGLGPSEEVANRIFSDLVGEGIFKPVSTREHNQVIDRCTIHPTIHRQLVSECNKGREHRAVDQNKNVKREGTWQFYFDDQLNLRALLNVGHKYLNSEEIKLILADRKAMQVLQFGRWSCITGIEADKKIIFRGKSHDHIEVDDTDFLKKLEKDVTFLSLQGISGIDELPTSIGKLENLKILDLRACHNLEKLPQKQQSKFLKLKSHQEKWFNNLTHLDISECYLLKYMPKWVCEISNLEVLKGFVVGNGHKKSQFCRLRDLTKLKKLKKLGIKIAKLLDPEDAHSLESLDGLSVLTVIWSINEHENGNGSDKVRVISFPQNLEKLDIRCYPEADAADLLNPTALPKLKRLYIRAGKLTKINKSVWNVLKILRLRFVKNLKMDWYEIGDIFPNLEYLEYEQCVGLKRFPTYRSAWKTNMDGPFPKAEEAPPPFEPVHLTIISNDMTPLARNTQKILLRFTGGDCDSNSLGLDLVAVLDVSRSMEGEKMEKMKIAMLFVIEKLRTIDCLSIVIFSSQAHMRCNLCQMTKDSKKELEEIVMNLKASGQTNISGGLQMGLEVLKRYRLSTMRDCGIILMSDGAEMTEFGRAAEIHAGNVPIYTFGFGKYSEPKVLLDIARNSFGGTFSDVRNINNLTKAFSMCLAGLLTVVAQELTLTIMQVDEESTLEKIDVKGYPSSEDSASGSATIQFGNLYRREERAVLVDVHLPAIAEQRGADILGAKYSYKLDGELYESSTSYFTVRRVTMPDHDQHESPLEVRLEDVRQKIAKMMTEAIKLADAKMLMDARGMIADACRTLGHKYNHKLVKLLLSELEELHELMQSPDHYEQQGRAFGYALLSAHERQRSSAKGDDIKKFMLYATPFVENLLEQAKDFDNNHS